MGSQYMDAHNIDSKGENIKVQSNYARQVLAGQLDLLENLTLLL